MSAAAAEDECAVEFISASQCATEDLAARFAMELSPGDVYLLHGDVGAGKSVFSRAFVRAVYGDPGLTVPSPTFLLQNVYDEVPGVPPVYHFDLYRLQGGADLERLQLSTVFPSAVSLVEWPERLGDTVPEDHFNIQIRNVPQNVQQRHAALVNGAGAAVSDDEDEEDDPALAGANTRYAHADESWRAVRIAASGARYQRRVAELVEELSESGVTDLYESPPEFVADLRM